MTKLDRRAPPVRFVALLAVVVLMLSACGAGSVDEVGADAAAGDETAAAQESSPAEPEGVSFPDFVATTADGGQIDFGALEGQDTVLWFWAPW